MIDIGAGVLIGTFAGLYFGVVILVLLTIIVLLGTAIIDVAKGLPLQIMLFDMACIWVSLQFAYCGSAFLVSRSWRESRSTECENAPNNNMYVADQNALCEDTLSQVHEDTEVVGLQTRRLYRHLELNGTVR
jgi:hypothetical protein